MPLSSPTGSEAVTGRFEGRGDWRGDGDREAFPSGVIGQNLAAGNGSYQFIIERWADGLKVLGAANGASLLASGASLRLAARPGFPV
jgi:hypothetical protein